jgi:acetyl-CoA carboxylase carboxyl transferase subunit alpha
MATLKTPILSVVIGEGGSGGALAIAVGDHLIMLEYSIYSVISPEGCASILWKNAEKAEAAATAMGITSQRLEKFGLVDEVIAEPVGGAHRNPEAMAQALQNALVDNLRQLEAMPITELLARRQQRIESVGQFREG